MWADKDARQWGADMLQEKKGEGWGGMVRRWSNPLGGFRGGARREEGGDAPQKLGVLGVGK